MSGQPLVAGEQPVGFLGLGFRDRTTPKPGQIELIQALAHQMAKCAGRRLDKKAVACLGTFDKY